MRVKHEYMYYYFVDYCNNLNELCWCLSLEDLENMEWFLIYAGKRIQRLHLKTSNTSSGVGLGWMHLENAMHVEKAFFIRTIILLKDDEVIKLNFHLRFE